MANPGTGGMRPSKPQNAPKPKATSIPKPTQTRIAPMQSKAEAKAQEKALNDLMKKREAIAKKTGVWNNYSTN